MHLADAVPIIVPRPLPRAVADRRVLSAQRRQPRVTTPFVGVDHRQRQARSDDDLPQGRAVGMFGDRQPDLTAGAARHPAHRRAVALPTAVATGLVGPPPRRGLPIEMGGGLLARILGRLIPPDRPIVPRRANPGPPRQALP